MIIKTYRRNITCPLYTDLFCNSSLFHFYFLGYTKYRESIASVQKNEIRDFDKSSYPISTLPEHLLSTSL